MDCKKKEQFLAKLIFDKESWEKRFESDNFIIFSPNIIYVLQKAMLTADNENGLLFNRTLSLSLLTEGSFSDSGISDEGSEQELSEREHRLSAIRRLVRQLEAIMAPDSDARIKMTKVGFFSKNVSFSCTGFRLEFFFYNSLDCFPNVRIY